MIYAAWLSQQAAQICLFICLLHRGLARRYKWFSAFLVVIVLRDLALMRFDVRSHPFALLWTSTEPFLIALQVMLVIEAASMTFDHYPKIGPLGILVTRIALTVGLLSSVASIFFDALGTSSYAYADAVLRASRWASCSSAIALAVLLLWLKTFRVGIKANLIYHLGILSVFFWAQAVPGFFLRTAYGQEWDALKTVVECACYIAWIFALKPSGEVLGLRLPQAHAEVGQELDTVISEFKRGMNGF